MTAKKALVLIGYSGSGKDTLTRMAQARFVGVGNCKFGEFNKLVAALALGVAPSCFEDKHWRVTENILHTQFGMDNDYHLSPLDLLSVLFVGGTSNTPVGEHWRHCYQSYTIAKAKTFDTPVFTDIRHPSELAKVRGEFDACVVKLQTFHLAPAANDTYIEELRCDKVITRHQSTPATSTFEELLTITNPYWR